MISADIEQMFCSFVVREDLLRCIWYKDNDTSKDITEFRMKVYIFGNTPSPSIAIYGLKRTADQGEVEYGEDANSLS